MDTAHKRMKERIYPNDQRVAWGAATGGPLCIGRIRDLSDSGIGLTVRGDSSASIGQAIRVLGRQWDHPRRARIIRCQIVRTPIACQTVLGCRWLTKTDTRTGRPARTLRLRCKQAGRNLRKGVSNGPTVRTT
jgi:hypothetical protein